MNKQSSGQSPEVFNRNKFFFYLNENLRFSNFPCFTPRQASENSLIKDKNRKKKLASHIRVKASPEIVWKHITRVQIARFADPWYFRVLDIPKPIRAEITRHGKGGRRIAYFANRKRFNQQILTWNEPQTYAFTFEPEANFRVGWLFNLADGPFQLISGTYYLQNNANSTTLTLETTYQIADRCQWMLGWPVHLVLKQFQHYLLQSIKEIAGNDS